MEFMKESTIGPIFYKTQFVIQNKHPNKTFFSVTIVILYT